MHLPRLLQEETTVPGNCVGDASYCASAEVLFTVTGQEATQFLVILAASVGFIKTLLGIRNYSHYHLFFCVVEIACTASAFAIFLREDYHADFVRQVELGYGDDIILYLLSFCGALVSEWANILATFQTVVAFQRVQRHPEVYGNDIDYYKQGAQSIYLKTLVIGSLLSGIVPLIAFAKAGWDVDTFGPVNFHQDHAQLIMCSLVLWLITQGLMTMAMTLTFFSPTSMMVAVFASSCVGFAPILASGGIMYTVLARVNATEAGGLCYLLMIHVVQTLEFATEFARSVHWLQIDLIGKVSSLLHGNMDDDDEEDLHRPMEDDSSSEGV